MSVSQQATVEAFNHDQMLLRAIYKAQRVLYKDKYSFIQCINIALSGGGVDTIVYLTGNSDPIPSSEISLAPEHT